MYTLTGGLEGRRSWQNLSPILILTAQGPQLYLFIFQQFSLLREICGLSFLSETFSLKKGYSSYRAAATLPTYFISRKSNEHLLRAKCFMLGIGNLKKNKKQCLPQGNSTVQ